MSTTQSTFSAVDLEFLRDDEDDNTIAIYAPPADDQSMEYLGRIDLMGGAFHNERTGRVTMIPRSFLGNEEKCRGLITSIVNGANRAKE